LKSRKYCFPLTVSDLASQFILGVDAHPAISPERSKSHFTHLFEAYGLPKRIRTDNGVPFASNALARLSQLAVVTKATDGADCRSSAFSFNSES
jgi:putative transposase